MLWNHYNNALDLFIESEWNIDKKRKYRQTTGIIYFSNALAIISLILSIYYNLFYVIILEFINILFCLYEYSLLNKNKLKSAQKKGIYFFEIQVFITAILFSTYFLDNFIWSYPLLLTITYPAIAALFDLSILKHFSIIFLQIILIQFLYLLFPSIFFNYIDLLEQNNQVLIKFVSFSYLILFSTIITYLIYNEQLIATKKIQEYSKSLNIKNEEIKQLNKSKDRLFSIISHDLRSPFNSIIGFSYLLLQSKELNNKQMKYSEIIHESSKSTLNLLDNLLYWSRSQMNSIEPNFKTYFLYNIINEVIENLNTVALQKNIILNNNVNPGVEVFVDINLIEIIIRNLISNAIKFSNKNSSIEIYAERQTNNFLKITIKDYGIGIPKDKIKSIFENQATELGTDNEKGSGLGLLLCKEFVSIHEGEIWAESEIKKGTEVSFTVPFD